MHLVLAYPCGNAFFEAIRNRRLFDESERATLALTYEMTRDITAKKATMKQIRSFLPDQQVVELIGTIPQESTWSN